MAVEDENGSSELRKLVEQLERRDRELYRKQTDSPKPKRRSAAFSLLFTYLTAIALISCSSRTLLRGKARMTSARQVR
jgi:hypothetical protein